MLIFSKHALKRIAERKLSAEQVSLTADAPDKLHRKDDEYQAIKLFGNKVVIVIYSLSGGVKFIITAWETKKIKKYLP